MPTKLSNDTSECPEADDTDQKVVEKELHLWAPIKLLQQEKLYWFWLVTLIISFLGIIINSANGEIETCFASGAFYSTCIAIISPFLVEFFVELTVKQRKQEEQNFITYKSLVFGISILYIIISCILIGSKLHSLIWLQIVYVCFSIAYSFYIYLVTKMDDHSTFLKQYGDKEYNKQFNEDAERLTKKANNANAFTVDDGRSVSL